MPGGHAVKPGQTVGSYARTCEINVEGARLLITSVKPETYFTAIELDP